MKIQFKSGDRVKVIPSHPFRAHQVGTLGEWDKELRRWEVEFDEEGVGYDGGKFLKLDEISLILLNEGG
jgi:transcription antitermination factor NusG